jgi:hypothetical protein
MLCGDGSQGPYDEGFALPEGLRRHLVGWGNTHQCRVTHAAFVLAKDYWKTTIGEAERQQRIADSEELERRKKTEVLFRVSPHEEPELIEGHCHFGERPRTPEELQWAENRLRELGFDILLDQRVKSYVKDYVEWIVYADLRFQKKITFCVYSKPVNKRLRSRSQYGSFYVMDVWKNDLVEEFEERCRNAVPQSQASQR